MLVASLLRLALACILAGACTSNSDISDSLAGRWTATASTPFGPMHLHVDVVETDGVPRASLTVPEDFVLARQLAAFSATADAIEFDLPVARGALRFRGARAGKTWAGRAAGGERELELVFTRTGPVPIRPYDELPFEADSGAVRLAGSLLLPAGAQRVPVVVLLHGSTSPSRDDFRHFADAFARAGVGALIFDKRDGGGALGGRSRFSLQDLAADARALVAALGEHPRVDRARIGLWGLSQGGWVAPIAAADEPTIAFVISISGPCATYAEIERFQIDTYLGRRSDVSPEQRAEALAVLADLQTWARAGGGEDPELERRMQLIHGTEWGRAIDVFERLPTPVELREQVRWRALDLDPVSYWERVRVPVLAVFGEQDRQIPVGLSVERLRAALANHPAARIEVLEGGDHELHGCAEYPDLVIEWLRETLAQPVRR